MEFWGVEVKPGEPLKVPCDAEKVIHISQASLGEIKDDKAAKNVVLRLRVEQGIFIIGSLSAGERPQISTDLILDRPFELSHDLKSGSVYFLGYSNDESESEDFDSEEDLPILAPANETPELKADDSKEEKKTELKVDDSKQEKKTAAPQQVSKKHALKTPEPAKEEPASEDDDDSDDDVENDDGDSEEEVSDDDEEDDESDEEPEEKPKEKSKKRQSEPIVSPPKKAKAAAANKPVAKKGTPQAAQPKKSQQPMKNSNKNQKKPFPKKR